MVDAVWSWLILLVLQKKKKKVHKVPAEVINDRSTETRGPAFNTTEPGEEHTHTHTL